ncbi:hypothetical protein EXS71_00465 [Candidatus Uhrbacteria bacterium]|nr:hypothetical protein [Candidatus Uhrbacteria bacterium]
MFHPIQIDESSQNIRIELQLVEGKTMLTFVLVLFVVGGSIGLLWLITLPIRKRNRALVTADLETQQPNWNWHEATACEIEFAEGILLACRLVIWGTGADLRQGFVLFGKRASLQDLCTLVVRTCKARIWETVSKMDWHPPKEEDRDLGKLRAEVSHEIMVEFRNILAVGGYGTLPQLLIVLSSPKWLQEKREATGAHVMPILEILAAGLSVDPTGPEANAVRRVTLRYPVVTNGQGARPSRRVTAVPSDE